MSAHTPGPWDWHGPYMTGAYKVSALKPEGGVALSIYINPGENGETGNNAKLIAAAPELAEALREIASLPLPILPNDGELTEDYQRYTLAITTARAALAKAGL